MKYKTVLVLGGTGFLGKNLQKERPDWIYAGRSFFVENGIKCDHETDFLDYHSVLDLINGIDPDAVINLAADVGGIEYNEKNQLSIFENNMIMNTNTIKACRELEIDRVLSCLSTCAFPDSTTGYGWDQSLHPYDEENLFKAIDPAPRCGDPSLEYYYIHPYKGHLGYGWSKRMLHLHTLLARDAGYNYSTFAPSNLYGPHDHIGEVNSHFVAALVHKVSVLKENQSLRLFGNGEPLRQFMFAPDLIKLIPELLEKHNSDIPLIVAPDENLSIDELAKTAMLSINKEAEIEYSGDNVGQFRKDCSNNALKQLLGDIKFTSFRDGFKKTYEWYEENK